MKESVHVQNWLRPTQTVCGVSVQGRSLTEDIKKIQCDVCVLRILRTGQRLGLTAEAIGSWTLAQLQLWRGEE